LPVSWQYCPPEVTWSVDDGGGGLGPLFRLRQITQPERVTEPSVYQLKLEPAETDTPRGPLVPWYRRAPIVT